MHKKNRKRNKNIFFNLVVLSILVLTSGCTSLNSKFDCPKSPGISCKSISEINAMVNKGQVGNPNNNKKIIDNLSNSIWDQSLLFVDNAPNSQVQKDQGLHIWMAPYEDSDGNFHEQTYVYAKIKNGMGAELYSKNTDEKALSLMSKFKNVKNKCDPQKTC